MANTGKDVIKAPPRFTAKRQGYYYRTKYDTLPTNTANAYLLNLGLPKNDRNYITHLWIDSFTSGFRMVGSTAQSASYRTYFPRNITFDDITIHGQVISNYDYDRLVEFVTTHHQTALAAGDPSTKNVSGATPLKFVLKRKDVNLGNKKLYTDHKEYSYNVYVRSVTAGAERFKNARDFQLELLVASSYKDTTTETMEFKKLLSNYRSGLFFQNPVSNTFKIDQVNDQAAAAAIDTFLSTPPLDAIFGN